MEVTKASRKIAPLVFAAYVSFFLVLFIRPTWFEATNRSFLVVLVLLAGFILTTFPSVMLRSKSVLNEYNDAGLVNAYLNTQYARDKAMQRDMEFTAHAFAMNLGALETAFAQFSKMSEQSKANPDDFELAEVVKNFKSKAIYYNTQLQRVTLMMPASNHTTKAQDPYVSNEVIETTTSIINDMVALTNRSPQVISQ